MPSHFFGISRILVDRLQVLGPSRFGLKLPFGNLAAYGPAPQGSRGNCAAQCQLMQLTHLLDNGTGRNDYDVEGRSKMSVADRRAMRPPFEDPRKWQGAT
jgi:hypothetical protein